MDWIDYRKQLGIGFSNKDKANIFIVNFFNFLGLIDSSFEQILNDKEYFKFCAMTGTPTVNAFTNNDIFRLFRHYSDDFLEYLSFCVALVNAKEKKANDSFPRKDIIKFLEKNLNDSHIPFEVLYDEKKNYFIFPKGAKELDDALVSEPLEWLKSYPKSHKTFCIALQQYSEGIYIRDVADNLRKALEEFLQEFLNNTKNLENNKKEICKYLGEQNVDPGISGLYKPLMEAYKNINDRIAKHNDKVDKKLLEFLLYQTGVLIRMTITIKNAETSTSTT